MDDLWHSIASIATALHQDRIDAVARVIERIESPTSFDQCVYAFGPGTDPRLVKKVKQAWLVNPMVTGKEIAFGLRAAVRAATAIGASENIDLVWTGPKTGLIPTRNTEQVIREVIDAAVDSLFIVSYVFYNASSIVAGLNEATDRGVSVRVLLESSIEHGGAVTGDGIRAMHQVVPNAELYIWNPTEKAKIAGPLTAAVHAKCAVADQTIAFVTSANLTSAAMERNMELGVLVRGGATPTRLHSHLNALVSTGMVVMRD